MKWANMYWILNRASTHRLLNYKEYGINVWVDILLRAKLILVSVLIERIHLRPYSCYRANSFLFWDPGEKHCIAMLRTFVLLQNNKKRPESPMRHRIGTLLVVEHLKLGIDGHKLKSLCTLETTKRILVGGNVE